MSFEVLSLKLYHPTLIGTWQRILLTNWPVFFGHLLVSSFVFAVLAGEGTQRATLGLVFMKWIRTMRHKSVSLTLAFVADCRRKQGDGTVGTSQLTVWQWLTHVRM